MAWNFQMPFYRKESGTLWMVYVNLHKSICPRVFSMTIYYFRIQKVDPLVAEQNWQRGEDVEENSWGGVNSSKMARYFLKPIMQTDAAAEAAAEAAAAALPASDIP